MTQEIKKDDIKISQFAKKHVKRLNGANTLWDAIELMNDFNIRHVPVENGSKIVGIVNPRCLIKSLEQYTDPSTFDQPLENIACKDYISIPSEASMFEVIKEISSQRGIVSLLVDNGFINGIYTEIDILNTDFLWTNLANSVINKNTEIGMPINEFTCAPSESTIQQVMELMIRFEIDFIGIIDESSKTLYGALNLMDIIKYLMHHYKELNENLEYLLMEGISNIFPSTGIYLEMPILISDLRRKMHLNDVYFAILLNENKYPSRIISVFDLLEYLMDNSDYFND